jgi:hypothetical protein
MKPDIGDLDRRRFLSALSGGAGMLALNHRAFGAVPGAIAARTFFQLQHASIDSPHRELYRIRELSERELLQTYIAILKEACLYADSEWKVSAFDPQAGYWGDGVGDGNGGIRTIASMLLACASLIKYDDGLDAAERRRFLDKSVAALRYATATHRTGTQKCTDGKPWGATENFGPGSWQSGMWTGTLAWGTWLIWDQLEPALQRSFQQVIAWECDILSHRPPPNGLWLDTKAEENGWEVPCLVLGELIFPSDPHASLWHETALKYMMNTLCTEADTHDATLVDGRSADQWVTGANLQPDFTLENHNIFHPAYVGCSSYFLTQAVMYYTYGARLVPQAATHHLMNTWRMFQSIILPWGEAAYPQGMDWELHGLPYINLYASLATHWRDPFAARMEQCSLQYLSAWQQMGHGSLSTPGSRFGITRHAINAEQAAYGFLAHKIFGSAPLPLTAQAAAAREEGVHEYPYVDFIAHRTQTKFVSFSWKNRVMGVLMPIGSGHEGNPDFTVPIPNGFVGTFVLDPVGDAKTDAKINVVDHQRRKMADGFETTGTLLLNGGRLRQTLKVTSLGSQTVIYEDEVTALADLTVQKELGVPFGIENDEITGGARHVSFRDGVFVANWQEPKPVMSINGSWANIDGRLGVVSVAGSGLYYVQGSGYLPGISVCADILYGSYFDRQRHFKQDQVVARRVAIFFVEVTTQETSRLAKYSSLEEKRGTQILRFRQPNGEDAQVTLSFGRVSQQAI